MRFAIWVLSAAIISPSLFGDAFSILKDPRTLTEKRKEGITLGAKGPISKLVFKVERARENASIKISQGDIKIATYDVPKAEPGISPPVVTELTVPITNLVGVGTVFYVELLDGQEAVLKDVIADWIPQVERFEDASRPVAAAFKNCLNKSIVASSGKCTFGEVSREVWVGGKRERMAAALTCTGTEAEVLYKHFNAKVQAEAVMVRNVWIDRVLFGHLDQPLSSQCSYEKKNGEYRCTFALDIPCGFLPDLGI